MIQYYRLFDLLKRKNMKISDLRGVISSSTIAKINKGQMVGGDVIDKICVYLDCQPNDIIEVIKSEEDIKRLEKSIKLDNTANEIVYNVIKETVKLTGDELIKYIRDNRKTVCKKMSDYQFQKFIEYVENKENH